MLPANHGQNRPRGCPFRSFSAMTLMPFRSTAMELPATTGSVVVAMVGFLLVLRAWQGAMRVG